MVYPYGVWITVEVIHHMFLESLKIRGGGMDGIRSAPRYKAHIKEL